MSEGPLATSENSQEAPAQDGPARRIPAAQITTEIHHMEIDEVIAALNIESPEGAGVKWEIVNDVLSITVESTTIPAFILGGRHAAG